MKQPDPISTCNDCRHRIVVWFVDLCNHPRFTGKGRNREINNGVILGLCPLEDALPPALCRCGAVVTSFSCGDCGPMEFAWEPAKEPNP